MVVLFGAEGEELPEETDQPPPQPEAVASRSVEQKETPLPTQLPLSLSHEEYQERAQHREERHAWIGEVGAQDRRGKGRSSQRMPDLRVSPTDPDATLMLTKHGADRGYHTHSVVDGGKARIILQVLVTPSEVMDNQPMLDLLWRVRFRWKLWPRQVTGDRKYGTEHNIAAIEREHIHAYIPLPDHDHRTEFFSPERFRYEAARDIYICPAGKELHFVQGQSTDRQRRYRAYVKDCNACPLQAQCTPNKQGRSLCRSVDEEYLDRVRAYQPTKAYKKAPPHLL